VNKALLILDVAHGANVLGKRSPDGLFQEWMWSRGFCRRLDKDLFANMKKGYDVIVPYLHSHDEPGLFTRVKVYNSLSYDYEFTLMASMHNNLAGTPAKWWRSTRGTGGGGVEIWTDQEHNHSDELADVFMNKLMEQSPEEVFRLHSKTDASKDRNFVILYGYKENKETIKRRYEGFLFENLFMDNTVDIKKLKDPKWNTEWVKIVGLSLHEVFKHKGYAN
jgi:hypothetical protein